MQSGGDYGISEHLSQQAGARLLRRDGGFNVDRRGLGFFQSLHLYHALVTMSWPGFLFAVVGGYLGVNLLFAAGYWLCGPAAITGEEAGSALERLAVCFYFSVQTFSTIGYGGYSPATPAAHALVTLEAIAGMLGAALATGLFFARFSRPNARILFSEKAVIAPFEDGTAWMIRIANARKSQLMNIEANVVLLEREPEAVSGRRFYTLRLQRERIMFLPLHWVIVHPITPESPLWNRSAEEIARKQPEWIVLLTAVDETFSETVHARHSYGPADLAWGARFANDYRPGRDGQVGIDLSKLGEIEPAEFPSVRPAP